jgi:hypothetical protein
MEIEIYVGESGCWVVREYPKTTEENDFAIELVREAEGDRTDTVDTAQFPPGLHKVRVAIHAEKSNFESEFEDDVWFTFEPVA